MRLKEIHLRAFKRFTDTHIQGLPASARLIVLAGPNGSGKSSLFDGLKTWHWVFGSVPSSWDEAYGAKVGVPPIQWPDHVRVEFHEPLPEGTDELKKLIYIRSAFRHEADFNVTSLGRVTSPLDSVRVQRMIDNDQSVSDNYQRMIMATISGIFSQELPDDTTKAEVRDRIVGQIQRAMQKVFPDLVLEGVGEVMGSPGGINTFYFTKGTASNFLYKNLSAGEKAAFDLILDAVVKGSYFDNSVWCIDEPESHLNTRVQASLMRTLVELVPPNSQMIIASHSIGFMREAWEMAKNDPNSVVFLDLQDLNFDEPQVILPTTPSRQFWSRALDVALGDLAQLVAPEEIVLCEGRPRVNNQDRKAEFDASCYRVIFAAEKPNTDFLSIGNSDDVRNDRLGAGQAIQAVNYGTRIIRVVDRDLMDAAEVQQMIANGVRVLSRRHIEAFLLDDEVLQALCEAEQQSEKVPDLIVAKQAALQASIGRGNDPDDLKRIAGDVYNEARRLLSLTQPGSNWDAFAKGKLAPLLRPGMKPYEDLRADIFD
ncbi:AAA family ATPase [Mycobacterium sp. Dal123C01]|uniref:AAA family ATPase n=1 Tax=Mycobacterium sp. Dal123C01 TaxID=3457577 RepID=UPI00403EA92F